MKIIKKNQPITMIKKYLKNIFSHSKKEKEVV